jgi:hypothetical protein
VEEAAIRLQIIDIELIQQPNRRFFHLYILPGNCHSEQSEESPGDKTMPIEKIPSNNRYYNQLPTQGDVNKD